MRVLLDTHALLWWLTDDPALSRRAHEVIADPDSVLFVSAASLWEISVKSAAGRIDTGDLNLPEEIASSGFLDLPINSHHAWQAGQLPRHHGDPFDRLLAAQALRERLVCVTRDKAFARYGVPVLW